MIRLTTIETGEPTQEMLIDLRKHAAVPDKSQDALLMSYIRKALPMVQDAADVSLVPETLVLEVTEREDNSPIRLYKTIDRVISVVDGDGQPVPFKVAAGFVKPGVFTPEVVITYTTKVIPAAAKEHIYDLCDYAANLYAGATEEDKAKQLRAI